MSRRSRAKKKDRKRRSQDKRPLRPKDVFTPNGFPLEAHNVYAAREAAENALQQAMDRNRSPLVFGEFGVGKTTLIKRFFLRQAKDGRFIHMYTPKGKTIEDLTRIVLERMHYTVETSREDSTTAAAEVSTGTGQFVPLKARLTGKLERTSTTNRELVVRTPTDQGLLEVMAHHRLIIGVDEMHKADGRFREQLAEMIKAVNTQGLQYPKVVVLGTAAEASELVALDQGIDRLVKEIPVAPMSPAESEFVVRDGMRKLRVAISDELVNSIVHTAAGAPALVHEMCLDVAERAVARDERMVETADLDFAVKHFLTENHARLTSRYMKAIETMGPRRYRKQILRAMAESPSEYVTREELARRVSSYVEANVPGDTLSGPLKELKSAPHGRLLRDVERSSGGRVHNLTAFNDPQMKAFIRAVVAAEEQGRGLTEAEIAALPDASEEE
jgi:hypothetical protein